MKKNNQTDMKNSLEERFKDLSSLLVEDINPQGFWSGELSSSALAVAVSVAALHFHDQEAHKKEIQQGLKWLQKHVNIDGSFGDSPESKGNVSTSLLVYAACNLYALSDKKTKELQHKIAVYLQAQNIDVNSPQVSKAILSHYQKDYTFSVPILTLCGLCGVPGPEAFKYIPQLPFELSLLPAKFYRLLNLSVVSYAIPALIAVGIVVFKKKKSNAFWRFVRKRSERKALELLQKTMPESGGFLEAIPLTAFVCMSLTEAGYRDLEVVEKGIGFLKNTCREDGSWPIDVDLSTWVTTLSVKSLRGRVGEVLSPQIQQKIAGHLKTIQNKNIHPFNGSQPGGWGWTNFSGSVPDGDDTPGAILALLMLQPKHDVKTEVLSACRWLSELQNNDGGFPTFSRGWGKLPFDQSCADLTGHCLLALSACIENYGSELEVNDLKKIQKSFTKALFYLSKNQRNDGSWLPLWFGNQLTPDHSNPVYGTAKVLTYLHDAIKHQWMSESIRGKLKTLSEKGKPFLLSVQNSDGCWGGDRGIEGSIEETALAVSALSFGEHAQSCAVGLSWLDNFYQLNDLKAAPIGLYFASLWYDEKLYPHSAYLEALSRILEKK